MAASAPESKSRHERILGWLRRHAQVQVILPAAVGIGLVAYIISLATAPNSGGQLWAIVRSTWWIILLLTIPYLAIRAFVWRRLLQELGITIPWRPLLVSFAGGEITKSLPAGIYVENYLLARLAHFRQHAISRSSMATTAMLGLESFIAVPILLIIGLPGLPWIFWTVIGIVLAWLVVVALAWLLVSYGVHHLPPGTWGWVRRVAQFLETFLEAGGDLLTWQTLWKVIPTALYLLVYAVDLYVIIRAVGVHNVSFVDTMSIYSFVVLTVILIPIPTEIGLTEFSGFAALAAFGIQQSTAAIIMLGLRALATGMTILVGGVLLLVLRGELSHPDPIPGATASQGDERAPVR
jgi:uncharacterized membrane protein YbhN (UPF0104 family)